MQVDPARSSTTLSPVFAAISIPFGKTANLTKAPAEPETETHVVQRGQVMSTIARLYNTDLKTLHELNPGVALDYVRPKQKITVPKVRGGGETKSGVATEAAVGESGVPDICVPKGELMLTQTHFPFLFSLKSQVTLKGYSVKILNVTSMTAQTVPLFSER